MNGRYISMCMDRKKIIRFGGMATVSLALLAGCSDSTSPENEFYGQMPDSVPSMDIPDNLASSGSVATDPNELTTSSNSIEAPANSSASVPTSSPNVPASSGQIVPASSAGITPTSSNNINSPTSSSSVLTPASSSAGNAEQVNDNPSTDRPVITYAAGGASVTNGGNCVTVTGGTVKITCGGEYDFSGSYSGNDAQILVASPKTDTTVYLNMKGLTLTNTADAPIYVQKSNKTFVVAKNGTTNTFTDASTRTKTYSYTNDAGQAKTDTTGACIYSKDDLTLKGEGTLIVKGNYNNGIHSTNDLRVKNGLITVTAKNNGMKGKGSVGITGGTINITTTGGDGIKSDTDDAADLKEGKGSIEITGGEITITSAFDGLSANNAVTIAKGDAKDAENGVTKAPTLKITTGGGQKCLGTSTGGGNGGRGGPGGGFGGGFGMGGNSCSPDSSMKGIKADSSIAISDGVIEINSHDDGIHSGGTVTFTGGKVTVKTDDDGVHADKALYVKDNANVNVTMAYEGMESPT